MICGATGFSAPGAEQPMGEPIPVVDHDRARLDEVGARCRAGSGLQGDRESAQTSRSHRPRDRPAFRASDTCAARRSSGRSGSTDGRVLECHPQIALSNSIRSRSPNVRPRELFELARCQGRRRSGWSPRDSRRPSRQRRPFASATWRMPDPLMVSNPRSVVITTAPDRSVFDKTGDQVGAGVVDPQIARAPRRRSARREVVDRISPSDEDPDHFTLTLADPETVPEPVATTRAVRRLG